MDHADWPALPYDEWATTKQSLHLASQMLGKVKLALAPPQPEWLHTRLFLDPRGVVTGPLPYGPRTVALGIDLFEPGIWLASSEGRRQAVTLAAERPVAEVWADFGRALAGLGVTVDLWDKPQEIAGTTPFSEDTRPCVVVPEHAQRYHRVLSSANGVFEEFRSRFFGRSGVQLWWGAFDFTVLLFNGRHAIAPTDRGLIMRYDLDAEHLNAGLWPGDDSAPAVAFYAYLVPRPPGCETVPVGPQYAGWVEEMGEWLMPYDEVRVCPDPRRAMLDFLVAVYSVATSLGGWDAAAYEYVPPPTPGRR